MVENLNAKHAKTVQAIFAKPTIASLEWARIESLFIRWVAGLSKGAAPASALKSTAESPPSIAPIPPRKPNRIKSNKPAIF